MKNYNVSDEPVTEVAVDINDIKDTCKEKSRNEECIFLVAGRMIYRKGLDFLFDALMRIPQETRYQVRVIGDGPELEHLRKRCKEDLNLSEHVHCMGSIPYMEMEKDKCFYYAKYSRDNRHSLTGGNVKRYSGYYH